VLSWIWQVACPTGQPAARNEWLTSERMKEWWATIKNSCDSGVNRCQLHASSLAVVSVGYTQPPSSLTSDHPRSWLACSLASAACTSQHASVWTEQYWRYMMRWRVDELGFYNVIPLSWNPRTIPPPQDSNPPRQNRPRDKR